MDTQTTMIQVDEQELKRLLQDDAMRLPDLNIVVSGMSGRFPKANSINEFEENLFEGNDMVNDNDESRFSCNLWGLPPRAGRLKDLHKFDCEFFGFTPEEANYIDFQMRILYEVVYESIIDAGVNPSSLRGTKTGVFFGLHCNEFENAMADDPNFKTNGYYAQFALKVAQYFDFRGLTVTFDAACASGFVGLHNAVQAINDGLVEQAIVCSSNVPIHPTGSFIFLQMQMLSPTGYSRFLDSRADGYVKSEAVVSCFLQRKHLAKRNYASIVATMTSVDGFKKEGITFPSDKSQESLIRRAKEMAGVSVNHIEYLEAHGTGTPAGDPQEAAAIANVYYPESGAEAEGEERKIGPLLVGSVKTNMGHSEAASGLCALAKIALMFENELIYGGLHFEQPNTNIVPLMSGKLKFVQTRQELKAKIIPLSCYGFGGSNVHAILRANEKDRVSAADDYVIQLPRLIVMFGRSEESLNDFFNSLFELKSRGTRNCLSEDFLVLLDQLNGGKIDRLMNYRGVLIISRDHQGAEAIEVFREIKKYECAPAHVDQGAIVDLGRGAHAQEAAQRNCNLILTGLGCQWNAMASGLQTFEPFWSTIKRLASILEPFEDEIDLIKALTDANYDKSQTMLCKFVTIVAYQMSLIKMLKDQLKLSVSKIIGHSLGEVSCAYASGLLDERESILVAYQLGKTLDDNKHLIGGKMVALELNEEVASKLLENNFSSLSISCINGPQSVTISGSGDEMDLFYDLLKRENIFFKEVEDSVALHNELIMGQEMKNKLELALEKVLFPLAAYGRDESFWVSSIDANANCNDLKKEANARYFAECLCKKVDFLNSINQLAEDSIALEVAPHGLFESQIRQIYSTKQQKQTKFCYIKMMKQSSPPEDQQVTLIKAIGQLYLNGVSFDLTNFYHGEKKFEFPVRRQTPSLCSLFKWKHEHEHFVPRYPIQFSKSSAKCEIPIDIVQDRDKYLTDHCIEGRILFPATGYLFLMWRVFSFTKRKIYDACFQQIENELVPIEFHNVRLLRAVILGQRVIQIYIHYEEGTGRFEIKEGGSVVVEGYARSPTESPDGLLYEEVKDLIREERLELTMNSDDIYKQFRVSGYDYGPTFRNIESSSADGRYCKVKFNGHFIALTDSILQSIFLAISQYAPSGGLFLPTKFDYVRLQPRLILQKLRLSNACIDMSESALNTKSKREIMTKIMQREGQKASASEEEEAAKVEEKEEVVEEGESKQAACIFETYCDPVTGIIITDGIEMRGIKATPAPRRSDNNEVLLECYQFVNDLEEQLDDERLTRYKQINEPYINACNLASIRVLAKICGLKAVEDLKLVNLDEEEAETYIEKKLVSRFSSLSEKTKTSEEEYDIKKNRDLTLLSVLDELSVVNNPKSIKEIIEKNRLFLMRDLIQNSFSSERFIRPLVETIIENTCVKKLKIKLLEVNVDDGIVKDSMQSLIQQIEPMISLDYSLAHPDIDRLTANKLLSTSGGVTAKTFQLKDLHSLFTNNQFSDLDLIIYKDISCYSLPKQVIERNGLAPVMSSLNGAVRAGGFVLMFMREKLTLAERILLALSEPELVGLSKRDLKQISSLNKKARDRIEHINTILSSRCELMMKEAERNQMVCLAKKSDFSGCTMLLFKSLAKLDNSNTIAINEDELVMQSSSNKEEKRVILRVRHDNQSNICNWLEELKSQFKACKEGEEGDETRSGEKEQEREMNNKIWLCAVASKQNHINGLIGMMRALIKELGASRLHCYFDNYTFKDQDEPINESDIENCEKFREALKRNLLWNCIDSRGAFGSYRHLTINNYMSNEECLCSKNEHIFDADDDRKTTNKGEAFRIVSGAYVNNATRGDLSSFTWYEAPFKYLDPVESNNLIRVAYSALNFRDVMLATGRLPLDAIPIRLATSDCLLGLEFSGFDAQRRRVIGMVYGRGIATHVICQEQTSIKLEVPEWMDLKEAATIPVVYATAVMALIYRGRMRRGESILIHAGSGGVGQAAIRLAAHHGLEIYTTVGSEEKRKFLLEEFGEQLKEGHIFSSRDCKFEEQLMELTRGRGVDLVLNSLADDKLQASLRCLADGGRFLEIGKYDMSVDARLELLKLETNKTFHGILLDKLFDTDTIGPAFAKQLKCVLETLKDGINEGYIKPIKHTTFKKDQIEEAFRFMATGKHIGKVLIEIDAELEEKMEAERRVTAFDPVKSSCIPRFQLSPTKSYIITGGLGGFGLELLKWIVKQGARNVLLTSRTGIRTGYQRSTLERLEAVSGARFLVVSNQMADTTTEAGVEKLCQLAAQFSPSNKVGAIFHLAMVLKDSLLENMSAEEFESVCKPKVNTCVYLDSITRKQGIKLDYFVAFSSITSGKGNAGQANYAYANSCLEQVCESRRQAGLHGLAIQWGAIGDVGVAFENLGGNDVIIGGTVPQRIPSCLATLARLLCTPFSTCLSVVPVNRSSGPEHGKSDLVGAIMHVLGIKDPSKVSDQATLGELGLDSLMAVEIRQYIEREYDMTLNIQEIRSLTIARIREINDNALVKASTACAEPDKKSSASEAKESVQSYGKKLTANNSPIPQQEQLQATLDRSMVSSFVPQLLLPSADYCRLNFKHVDRITSNGTSKAQNSLSNGFGDNDDDDKQLESRPIFFIPPIHGQFDRLEVVCSSIKRPCIGLNWTKKLGRARSVREAAEEYLNFLKSADWEEKFCLKRNCFSNGIKEKRVDLVGYSYGATIAFEMMLLIYKWQEKGLNGELLPGRLILLDGSPKQIELGSQFMSNLTTNKPLKLSEKVDQLLMVYMVAHTRRKNVDYIELQSNIAKLELEEKISFASKRLVEILGSPIANSDQDDDNEDDEVTKVALAMEAFCRRYELINNYKLSSNLPADCCLIRAEKLYLRKNEQSYEQDLELSSVVDGKVDLFIMKGDHETFLNMNNREIGGIIEKQCISLTSI